MQYPKAICQMQLLNPQLPHGLMIKQSKQLPIGVLKGALWENSALK